MFYTLLAVGLKLKCASGGKSFPPQDPCVSDPKKLQTGLLHYDQLGDQVCANMRFLSASTPGVLYVFCTAENVFGLVHVLDVFCTAEFDLVLVHYTSDCRENFDTNETNEGGGAFGHHQSFPTARSCWVETMLK